MNRGFSTETTLFFGESGRGWLSSFGEQVTSPGHPKRTVNGTLTRRAFKFFVVRNHRCRSGLPAGAHGEFPLGCRPFSQRSVRPDTRRIPKEGPPSPIFRSRVLKLIAISRHRPWPCSELKTRTNGGIAFNADEGVPKALVI